MKRIAATLIVLTSLCLSSCTREQDRRQESAPARPTAASGSSPRAASLLPAGNEIPGWRISDEVRSFSAASLWEYIDGAADRYLAYGFEEVATSEFVQEGTGYRLLIDIYRMKDPLGAFGIYMQERNPANQVLKIGNEGYATGTTLNFWIGSYYVKITGFEEKEALSREMAALANAVAAKVTAPGAEPAEAACFPKENQVPRSLVYIPRDILAQSYFTNGFEVKYRAGDSQYSLILVNLESPEAAEHALARYREFLSLGGKTVTDLAAPGQGGFAGREDYYGDIVAVRSGRYIAIALGAPSQGEGERLLAQLVSNLR